MKMKFIVCMPRVVMFAIFLAKIGKCIQIGMGHLKPLPILHLIYCSFVYFVHFCRLYCKHAERNFSSPEEELEHFINRTKNARWKWKGRTAVSPEHAVHCELNCSNVICILIYYQLVLCSFGVVLVQFISFVSLLSFSKGFSFNFFVFNIKIKVEKRIKVE